jgi:hypothetical protein
VTNRFWGLMLLAFLSVGLIVWGALYFNQANLVHVGGSILKVREQPTGPNSTLILADFRITNSSGVPFVVNSVTMTLDGDGKSAPVDSNILSKSDIVQVFQYYPLLKPQYNEALTIQDRIPPGQSVDRMAAASFDVPQSVVDSRADSRRTLRIRIEEVDGAVAEITEKK